MNFKRLIPTCRDQPFFFSSVHISFIPVIQSLFRQLEIFRILSLDVALGGVVFSNSLAHVVGVDLPFPVSFGLFLAIWLIYTFDHLLDAEQLKDRASMKRHQFHFENRRPILIVLIGLVLVGVVNMIFMPIVTLFYGLIVSAMVTFYFFLSWRLKVLLIKEIFIASIYAVGVLLGPVSLGEMDSITFACLIIQIFFLAFLNLLIISNYEMEKDEQDGKSSWAVRFGYFRTSIHIKVFFGILLIVQLGTLYFLQDIRWFQMLLILMTLVLLSVFTLHSTFAKGDRYRALGDFVFFIPGLIYLF